MLSFHEVEELIKVVEYKPGYVIRFEPTGPTRIALSDGVNIAKVYRWAVWIQFQRIDALTGELGVGESGRVTVSTDMTRSQIIRRLFGMCMALEEHECREFFRYCGKAVFGPHIDVDQLASVAEYYD